MSNMYCTHFIWTLVDGNCCLVGYDTTMTLFYVVDKTRLNNNTKQTFAYTSSGIMNHNSTIFELYGNDTSSGQNTNLNRTTTSQGITSLILNIYIGPILCAFGICGNIIEYNCSLQRKTYRVSLLVSQNISIDRHVCLNINIDSHDYFREINHVRLAIFQCVRIFSSG